MWRVLTVEDVAASLNQDEIDAYRQLPDFASRKDPVADLLQEVASYVRGFCRASGMVKLDPSNEYTLPLSLIKPSVDIVVYKILSRMPMEVIESRKAAWQTAEELMKQIASKQFLPESYGVTDDVNWQAVPMAGFSIRPNFTLRGSPMPAIGARGMMSLGM